MAGRRCPSLRHAEALRASKHSVRTIPSGPREIMRQFTLEFGEVARDHRHVEASEYRLLWLAVEQESEGCLKAAFRRMVPARQPVAHFTRHRHVVTSLAPSLANDHFEIERATLANAPDLDHGDLLVVAQTSGLYSAVKKACNTSFRKHPHVHCYTQSTGLEQISLG